MAPEGEGKLVVDACQDQDEMQFEGLDGALRLVASMVARWHQLKLDFLLSDILLEHVRGFIVQRVFLYPKPCPSHPVDYLLIRPNHLHLRPIAHWFNKDVICVEVDGHHYVIVSSLGRVWERSSLVRVDGLGEVRYVGKDAVCASFT